MVEVQLKGFPRWAEQEDLKYTVDQCGFPSQSLRIVGNNDLAEVRLPSWEAADAVVEQLHNFEFTPGYPLKARVKLGQERPPSELGSAPGAGKAKGKAAKASDAGAAKGGSKGASSKQDTKGGSRGTSVKQEVKQEVPETDSQFSAKSCIGAGRIEGWFLNSRANVLQKGWGFVQSYCFEGNVVYRPVNSPLLKDVEFAQKDGVTFEVMMIKGQCEAVRLATPEVEDLEHPDTPIDFPLGYGDEDEFEVEASSHSQKRRAREEADGRCMFFGGFGPEITEETLQKFAEQAGVVKKVKLFYHTHNWESKGCGKIQYDDLESAERALNEISGTILNERIVTVETLGQSSNVNPNPKRARQEKKPPGIDFNDDMPKQLPLSMFSKDDTPQAKLEICYAVFEDIVATHDPEESGMSMILMIRKIIMEVNDIFGEDEVSLQVWCQHLRGHQWFRDNQQVVKWQQSKKRVNISKMSPNTPAYINHQQSVRQQVEQRKVEQEIMGKPIFEVTDEEKTKARLIPDKGFGKDKGGKGCQKGGPIQLGGQGKGW